MTVCGRRIQICCSGSAAVMPRPPGGGAGCSPASLHQTDLQTVTFSTISVVLTLLGRRAPDCAAGRPGRSGWALRLGSGWSAKAESCRASESRRTGEALWVPLERGLLRYWSQRLHSATRTHRRRVTMTTTVNPAVCSMNAQTLKERDNLSNPCGGTTSSTHTHPFFRGSHDDAAGQAGVKHIVRLELAGRSGQGGEAGQTQLEAGRRGFGRRGRRRLRRHPLHDTDRNSQVKTEDGAALQHQRTRKEDLL